ncbi:hypothetical protein [Sinomicrobium sp. M5D2P9]
MKTTFLIAIVYCFIPQVLLAQQEELVLRGTEEKRNIGFWPSKLELTTELTGIEVDEKHQVSVSKINAVDNLGNTLKPIAGYPYPTNYFTKDNEIVIGIEPPIRKAKSVSIEGTIEYFTISEALKSKLNITSLQQHYHKNLLTGISGCKLVLIDIKGLSKLKEDEAAYIKKVKEIHKNAGVGYDVDVAKRYLDKAVNDYSYWDGDFSKLLHFYREDPNDAIVEIKVYKNGENLFNGTSTYSDTYTYSLKESLVPETELRIKVKSENAVKEIPFQLKNITLP